MFFCHSTPLPTLDQLHNDLSLPPAEALKIAAFRQKIEKKLQGSPGFLLVLGPCSIHHTESALEYGQRVIDLQKSLGNTFFIVMRASLEKPRSWGGWKGFITDPTSSKPPEVVKGIYESRKLFLELTKMGVPLATEFLNPLLAPYTSDLVTWGWIGARTSASAVHRELASSLQLPIAFKNGIDGSFEMAIQGVVAARQPQSTILPNLQGQLEFIETPGNPYTHLVLRGGPNGPNFQTHVLDQIEHRLLEFDLEPKMVIDCAHDNSQKDLEKQKKNFLEVFERYEKGEKRIIGAMVESFIERGKGNSPYLSATDPCLGWEETEELILSCR